jgi:hypothetical protein
MRSLQWITGSVARALIIALRRTQRMWLLGSDEELRRAEAGEIRAKETLKKLMANWREELSDDWDDSWDPFHPFSAVPR